MEIKNRYIKYIPEITSDIYDIIWKKCLSLKIEGKPYDFTDNSFEAFKKERYFFIGPSGGYSFGVDNNESKDTEITVRELLGFDPFVKDELVKGNFNQTTACEKCKYAIGYICLRNACNARNGQYYPKENSKKEIISEYVEFNNQIHKVKNWTSNTYCILENGQEPFKHLVKPSTKEAYDLQQKPKNQAVHCTTQEEWDFVLSKFNPSGLLKEWNSYKEKSCINLNAGWYSELSFYIELNYQILSFQEWCDLNNYSMEKDCTKASKEELLEEAKRRYPIGTKYKSAYDGKADGEITSNKFKYDANYHAIYHSEIYVYFDGKWAEIISLPEEKGEEKSKFEVGKWYKNLGDHKNYIAKATKKSKLSGNSFYHGDYIINNKKFIPFDGTGVLQWNPETIEVDLSEIQQYFPEGHPDKIKTCVPAPELKVGMWVRITKSDIDWSNPMDKFIGQVVQINKVIDDNRIEFENDGGWYWKYSNKHFEIVEPSCLTYSSNTLVPSDTSLISYDIETSDYFDTYKYWITTGYQTSASKGQTIREALDQLTNQSESIFPKFEIPKIDIKEEIISKDYFPKFKDPYINN